MRRARARSTASVVAGALVAGFAIVGIVIAATLVLDAQRAVRDDAERVTAAVAGAISADTAVASALVGPDPAGQLQPMAARVMRDAQVDFVTIMTPDGIRVTHANPENIGLPYAGTVPESPRRLTEEYTGTLGPSVRTIVPLYDGDQHVGWVSVGLTLARISDALAARLPMVGAWLVGIVGIGLVGGVVAQRLTRRVTGDLDPGRVHDAVSAYESIRTLGEALRAQTHEHGNRMHAAIALMELGRTEEAIEILAETAQQSQLLVDHAAADDGDPAVGALLLGKASQAKERGVQWTADIVPGTPRSTLSAVDAVSVVGNLIDNAIDAAAEGPEPRWVNVRLGPGTPDGVRIVVRDSGTGIPAELDDRVFEFGFSTKPAGSEGRGVGLALVRSVVEQAGGQLAVSRSPSTMLVTLPERTP